MTRGQTLAFVRFKALIHLLQIWTCCLTVDTYPVYFRPMAAKSWQKPSATLIFNSLELLFPWPDFTNKKNEASHMDTHLRLHQELISSMAITSCSLAEPFFGLLCKLSMSCSSASLLWKAGKKQLTTHFWCSVSWPTLRIIYSLNQWLPRVSFPFQKDTIDCTVVYSTQSIKTFGNDSLWCEVYKKNYNWTADKCKRK